MQSVERRLGEIMEAAGRVALAQRPLRLHLRIEPEVEKLGYFAKPVDPPQGIVIVEDASAQADLALFTQHGLDVAPAIWAWRQSHPGALVVLWAWDNHLNQVHNLHSALAADIVLPSHAYAAQRLLNPISLLGPHLPACMAQWQGAWQEPGQRSDRLMAHYVDYPWAERTKLLAALRGREEWVDLVCLPPGDKRGYFAKTPEQRLQEWLSFKTSLVLPVERDLSTRFFDALYVGQVPVLAGDFADLDLVAPESLRRELGIVWTPEASVEAVQAAHREALSVFDKLGQAGVQARFGFAESKHSMRQRIEAALDLVAALSRGGRYQPQFSVAPGASGLRLVPC